jgi:hypothetical protein
LILDRTIANENLPIVKANFTEKYLYRFEAKSKTSLKYDNLNLESKDILTKMPINERRQAL